VRPTPRSASVYVQHQLDFLDSHNIAFQHILVQYGVLLKECRSDSVTNYNYVGDTKISVSIKKTNANKCTIKSVCPILSLITIM